MNSTGSTASVECAFKNILNTCSNGEKNSLQSLCLLINLQS